MHVAQVVDELDLVVSYILVLLLDFDRLCQVKFDFRLLGGFLVRLKLGPQLLDFLFVTELVLLCGSTL